MQTRNRKNGFTLIEIMFVVLIILMLSGMLFKLGGVVKDRSERAKATADLANIEHVLNEYFAEYGIYPPVDFMAYEFEDTNSQPRTMDQPGVTNGIGWRYGLVSHLYKRDMARPSQYRRDQFDADTSRDEAAKERWAHYLADIHLAGYVSSNNIPGQVTQVYSNGVASMLDPWDQPYDYKCKPPYLSYELSCRGLD
jgi:prepilin-type N-terminal cleavage/methylation domain-containing protein